MSELATFIPLEEILTWWPDHLFSGPSAGTIAVTGYRVAESGGTTTGTLELLMGGGLVLAITGVEGVSLELPGGSLTVEVDYTGAFELRASDIAATLRVASAAVVPVSGVHPDWQPLLDVNGVPEPVELILAVGSLVVDEDFAPTFELSSEVSIPPFMIGSSGIVVEVTGIQLLLSGKGTPPPGQSAGFRGVVFERASVYLPGAFDLPGLSPDAITIDGLCIGNGGVSGTITGQWTASWDGLVPSGTGVGTFLGFPFALRNLAVSLRQNALTTASFEGDVAIPFFDQVVSVAISVAADGGFGMAVAAADDGSLGTFRIPGLLTLELTSLGAVHDEDGDALLLSGRLTLEVGAPVLNWPTIEVQDLRIGSDGKVKIPGGWIDLQEPLALDLYGFGLEITRIGFGNEDDGRRWIGVDGAVRLTELLPAGASARGLRVIWDPRNPSDISLALEGIGVTFGIPDAFAFEGEVSLADDPETGLKLFRGSLGLGLDALDIGIDADIIVGRKAPDTYVFVHLGVNVPIPLAATGAALYGLEGLFAMNMAPTATGGDWYGWYKKPTAFDVADTDKWTPKLGAWAFGAGLSVGTLPDAGFAVNAKALLVVLLPGPVILLDGKADIFKAPATLGGSSQESTLSLLAALDGRKGTLQLGIDAAWSLSRVIEIAASTEAFFDFDDASKWHLWIGQDDPESARIRADYLSLFHADAWLMLDPRGIDTGLSVSWGDSWKFGPARVTLEGWVGGRASLSTRPPQLAGQLGLGGRAGIAVGPFGVGIGVEAGLSGKSFAPYEVAGTLSIVVELPKPLKDLDLHIRLEWKQPDTPEVDDPFVQALVEHARCTESWAPVVTLGGIDTITQPAAAAPVVPLDAGVLLTFAKPMGDESGASDNPPAATPVIPIGDHRSTFELADLRLHRLRRAHPENGWQDVTDTVFGTWTPDAGDAGSRLQLFARSPFAFTRFSSRRFIDWFLEDAGDWPCAPAPELSIACTGWNGVPADTRMPSLWRQDGGTFATAATLEVRGSAGEHVLHLGSSLDPGQQPQPGLLWVRLPERASAVTISAKVGHTGVLALQAWKDGQPVGLDGNLLAGDVELHVVADGIDSFLLSWGFAQETDLVRVCWVTQASTDALTAWRSGEDRLEAAAESWSSDEPILEPDSHYLLEVTTRAVLTQDGGEVQRVEQLRSVQFQTGGPPGIPPAWLAPPEDPATFPYGGVLKDLAPYVRDTIPAAGAVPVFRGYDLGCVFDASHVQQMYGADMRVGLRDDNGDPVLDAEGREVVFANAWEDAPTTTLSTSDTAWLSQLDACTGAVEWTDLRRDDTLQTAVASLLYDDFSGTLATLWAPFVLDPDETRAANWHLDAGVLRQGVAIAGGDPLPDAPDKPGTVYVAEDVSAVDVALETRAWATAGAYGLVFRWQGPDDYYRFSAGTQRLRLVRVAGGVVEELWSRAEGYVPDAPTALAVQVEGVRIRCQVDERLICDVLDDAVPAAGAVGLYTWNSTTAAFDEVRARVWPGAALAAESAFTAELQASRPLFTDAFDDLGAFRAQVLATGAPVTTCSATGGVATVARAKNGGTVAVLATDPAAGDYSVECNAHPSAAGTFGLVARHTSPQSYLSLELTPGAGRKLVSRTKAGNLGLLRVLWEDDAPVEIGGDYALALRCEGDTVTVTIDGESFTRTAEPSTGDFGLLSGIPTPGACAFSDLVVRSAPRTAVHSWRFTTSRWLGLPDLLAAFAGRAWPADDAAPDRTELTAQADAAASRLTPAQTAVDDARAALASAIANGDALEVPSLESAAREAVAARHAVSAEAHDLLVAALGLPYRPPPPVVEVSVVEDGHDIVALLLDLPEPLPWERVGWSLSRGAEGSAAALGDLVLAWSDDGTRAVLVREGGPSFTAGEWALGLVLRLDVGAERAVWRRGGSTAPEVGTLHFTL